MLGIAVFRRPVAAWWAIAVAVLLLAVTACGTPPAPPARPVVADGNGGLTNVVANGYRIEAAPGTFPAGNEITIEAADAPTDVGNARVIGNPVQLSSSAQPAKPVIVDTAEPRDVDPALAIAVLRPPAGTGFDVLPVVRLDNGALRARVPHFSVLQFVVFPTVLDRDRFFNGPLQELVLEYLADFFDAPYDCPPAQFQSDLVELMGYPSNSVNLQVDLSDKSVPDRVVTMTLCNRLRFPMEYRVSGAAAFEAFAMPRSTARIDLPVRGPPGAVLTMDATYSDQAESLTLVFLVLAGLPAGKSVVERTVQKVLDPDKLALLANASNSCGSALDAVQQSPDPNLWQAALSCLQNNPDFVELVIGIWRDSVIEDGLMSAAEAAGAAFGLKTILAGQELNRLLAEKFWFQLPADVRFPYRLRCAGVPGADCAPRGAVPTTTSPTSAAPAPCPPGQVRSGAGSCQLPPCPAGQQRSGAGPCESAGDVPDTFLGTWSGGITQQNPPIPPFSLNVTIRQGAVGSTIASGNYTGTDPCSVHWTLERVEVNQLVVNEVVDSGTCFNNIEVTLTLTDSGTIDYDFESGNGRGELSR